ncbi:ribulose-phosphate 3-epimerase [Lactobacillus mulieris]|mgnify:CR=1 FL=1|jgi:ribulose-phosphate 3-epimerase|uniref:Ribulose-phosphate 3-epimerase n=1 Tax=Lactobacillus mulieris TaxID=2508708 RepID=A0AAP3M311_9LACO|nr:MULTISPECIES: ribulose-phosphate 3-epimerase [Lactobacillus]EEU21564.1 ribulose-phosphate 3-epimerase [Lactobacillus jensenii 27-2-CHN]EEX24435.1 ribulose-phosphate 3-epimerase [Lactobacillus jensenii 115-3-CHN]EFH29608.1 ribulose-phosphate 3-epimerase [Lactobacillus jensenii JV-V16]KAA9244894.1 ribulose-phosphate 3-epimerase [Lactobacillus jensenii]KAA9367548.1 ribulose-phosphate 3-epimerase [Lactobacillus jensenii]
MIISPSILNADNLNLGRDIKKATQAGITRFHIDIMDGHFVPNLSYGPQLVQDFKREFPLVEAEVHLMSNNLETTIPAFTQAGADLLEFHFEATNKVDYWLDYLASNGVKAGLVLNPETDVASLKPYLKKLKQVLLMSVHPGFGGQKYIPETAEKIAQLKQLTNEAGVNIPIEVDGGINDKTAPLAAQAGADILVCGSYIFKNGDIASQIRKLEGILNEGH